MDKNKLIKSAKNMDKIFNVLQKIIGAVTIVCLVFFVITLVSSFVAPDILIANEQNIFGLGTLTFEVDESVVPNNSAYLIYLSILLLIASLALPIFYGFIKVLRKLLKPMSEGNPFSSSVSGDIIKLGYLYLAVEVVENLGRTILDFATLHLFDIERIIENSNIKSITTSQIFNPTCLYIFVVLLLLSYIFKYGEKLQQLSDETV